MFKIKKLLFVALVLVASSIFVGCSEDVDVETESSITNTLTMTPDLLKFVTPQVRYIDENGNLVTITGVEELDGKVIENSAEISSSNGAYASSWTKLVVTGTGYKCWTINMKFKRLNFHSYMGVKYRRNEFVEDTDGKAYNFHHNINTSINAVITITTTKHGFVSTTSQDVKAYADAHISITPKEYRQGDDVEAYLKNVTNNPDKVGYYVDGDGNVTRRDEFDL